MAPERLTVEGRHDRLRRVLYDQQAMTRCDLEDDIHCAGDASVVHWHDGTGPRRDRRLDLLLIQVESVKTDIHEHRHRATQHEGVGGRHERVRRHDDFVARTDFGENCRHLQGGRAGMG